MIISPAKDLIQCSQFHHFFRLCHLFSRGREVGNVLDDDVHRVDVGFGGGLMVDEEECGEEAQESQPDQHIHGVPEKGGQSRQDAVHFVW